MFLLEEAQFDDIHNLGANSVYMFLHLKKKKKESRISSALKFQSVKHFSFLFFYMLFFVSQFSGTVNVLTDPLLYINAMLCEA